MSVIITPDEDRPVLKDFSLVVPGRKITAIVGPSGSGKSTVVDLMLGLLLPQEGEIIVRQHSGKSADSKNRSRIMSYVPQEIFLTQGTLKDNIEFGIESVPIERIQQVLAAVQLSDFVRGLALDVNTPVGDFGGRLSGGQRQRLGIARALVRSPDIIIMDEPTSAMDKSMKANFIALLRRLSMQATIVVVTHDQDLESAADHVVDLEASESVRPPAQSAR